MPVSACIGREEVMAAWGESSGAALHTGTFFGNPISAVAALATLDVLSDERLPHRAHMLGQMLCEALQPLLTRPEVKAIRGRGLLLGIELDSPERSLACIRALLKRGYITVPAGADARVVSLTPPLCITSEQLLGFVTAFTESLKVTS
jgi:4-aminobutyrate aminotransferase/(S)-3-amino-2-methylpropionate transaminase